MKDCLIPRRRNGSPSANGKMTGKNLTDKKLEKGLMKALRSYNRGKCCAPKCGSGKSGSGAAGQ